MSFVFLISTPPLLSHAFLFEKYKPFFPIKWNKKIYFIIIYHANLLKHEIEISFIYILVVLMTEIIQTFKKLNFNMESHKYNGNTNHGNDILFLFAYLSFARLNTKFLQNELIYIARMIPSYYIQINAI